MTVHVDREISTANFHLLNFCRVSFLSLEHTNKIYTRVIKNFSPIYIIFNIVGLNSKNFPIYSIIFILGLFRQPNTDVVLQYFNHSIAVSFHLLFIPFLPQHTHHCIIVAQCSPPFPAIIHIDPYPLLPPSPPHTHTPSSM